MFIKMVAAIQLALVLIILIPRCNWLQFRLKLLKNTIDKAIKENNKDKLRIVISKRERVRIKLKKIYNKGVKRVSKHCVRLDINNLTKVE